ncbi:DUF1858 domain-containing protein [Candidatus Dojkabacteria bacterium]|nr:DUF1858 domain-containing protein [Candidatus Dojkabacteria bacterium]
MASSTKSKTDFEITRDIPIIEITERFPEMADYLVEEYGFHCIGCPLSYMETLGEGMIVHGLDEAEQESLLKELNKLRK